MTTPAAAHARSRVVHLVEPEQAGEGSALVAACAARVPGAEHRVILLGGAVARDAARAAGLEPDRVAIPPLGMAEGLARTVRRWLREPGLTPDLVVAWSEGAAGLAARAAPSVPRLAIFTAGPHRFGRGFLSDELRRRALARTPVAICGPALAPVWLSAGASVYAGLPSPWFAGPVRSARAATRAALGLAEDETAVLLLADPPSLAHPQRFAHVLGIIEVSGRRCVGLVPDTLPRWSRAARYVRRFGFAWPFVRFQGAFLSALAAADVVVWQPHALPDDADSPRAGGAALALAALAAGVPVVSVDHPLSRGAFDGLTDADAMLASELIDHRIATVLRTWITDAPRRERLLHEVAAQGPARQAAFESAWSGLIAAALDRSAPAVAASARTALA